MQSVNRHEKREIRHRRVRASVIGTAERPRLCVYKSNTRVIAQIIDDEKGVTIVSVASDKEQGTTPKERAESAAESLAKLAKKNGVEKVVFDRGGFQYMGTVKAFADKAREAGLTF